MSAAVKDAAPAATEKESKVGYVGRRLSKKQMKLYLLGTPKHGPVSRRTMKFYMGLTKAPPGPAKQPPLKKKDTK